MQTAMRSRHSTSTKRHPKNTKFTLRAPSAKAVYLAGSFNEWNASALEMDRGEDGFWCAEVALPPGRYEYKFVVDGCWCCDITDAGPSETAEGCVPNSLGSMNRVIEVAQ